MGIVTNSPEDRSHYRQCREDAHPFALPPRLSLRCVDPNHEVVRGAASAIRRVSARGLHVRPRIKDQLTGSFSAIGPAPFEATRDSLKDSPRFVKDDSVWKQNKLLFHQWLKRVP